MNTGTHSSKRLHAIAHQVRRKGRLVFLPLVCLVIFLSSLFPAHALARETSPFANHLAVPPPFNPEAENTDTQADATAADNQQTQPLVSRSGKAPVTKGKPEKEQHHMNPDINNLPPPGAGSRKISQAIAASKKDDMIENEWKMGFELRSSPVLEEHGNAERHDSIGGLVKGHLKF
ncbi:hypothetical protein NB640_10195 [Oxalobacter vibrioformis]|uniref:Uncharacterized protein n=1 Tax=Oxalobacter vibrioformis TaxID=933080 RepID=A0A9E9LZ69_9BURK|nr:hypothetical protein [Oxalobacter vibrioformis]WAW09593.1 hypothetical protein NB640_10195 [Oxalobacter vibrioformis]